jgi:hypothetical protein
MKKSFILHLALALNASLLANVALATLPQEAPPELKTFVESDFDSIHMQALKTHAVPLKILIPALILEGRDRGWIAPTSLNYQAVFKRVGLNYPDNVIYNNKVYAWKSNVLPVGLTEKEMDFGINANIKIVNLSCTACHSGLAYDEQGKKTNNLIIGAPSDTFNPETYVGSIYRGMKKVSHNWNQTYDIINQVFPETKIKEKILFKTFIRAQVNSYIKKHAVTDSATPFLNGGPGLTNGVASLKNVLSLDVNDGSASGFTSIPSIGDRGFRSSLLYDGVYSIARKEQSRSVTEASDQQLKDASIVAALFTVPTMGQTPKRALKNIDYAIKNISPILKTYKTPEFPGTINSEKAERGFAVYNNNCLQCHGEYKWEGGKKSQLVSFPNVVVPQNEMNSDANRWQSITPALTKKLQESPWNDKLQFNHNQGYVAPILEGLWASAPYMHNGSVPTLYQFMHPETRPAKFNVGNQNLDLDRVGILAEVSGVSEVYDTSLKGRGNRGHEVEFSGISESEKDELLEYLKTL